MSDRQRRLLITGATGGIGARLRERIDAAGIHNATYVLGRSAEHHGDAHSFALDITDSVALEHVLERSRPDAVIHLAAMTGSACDLDPDRARAVNTTATERLALACDAAGVSRIVFASTAALYGDKATGPVAEDAALDLASTYAQTKGAAEDALECIALLSPTLSTVALRIFNVFGETLANSLVTRLRWSTQAQPVALNGLDAFVRDYVHVDDVVDAILLAVDAGMPAPHTAINIGTGTPTTNRMLLSQLEVGGPVWVTIGDERPSYSCADISRARNVLDFQPRRRVTD